MTIGGFTFRTVTHEHIIIRSPSSHCTASGFPHPRSRATKQWLWTLTSPFSPVSFRAKESGISCCQRSVFSMSHWPWALWDLPPSVQGATGEFCHRGKNSLRKEHLTPCNNLGTNQSLAQIPLWICPLENAFLCFLLHITMSYLGVCLLWGGGAGEARGRRTGA